jgi:anti-anti-sigma regulatory factor
MSVFEMTHVTEHDEIFFRIVDEASGFGNRDTGRQLRTKLQNIMTQFPNSRVVVDFADVALVSASFADEFIAKLVIQLGHFSFFNRVTVSNASRFIRQTLDNVIRQRSESERFT